MQREKTLLQLLPLFLPTIHSSPNNFCGSDWTDASSDCQNRQPCPGGIDDECDPPTICWADTLCDTTKGDGILFDQDHPQHKRFCGKSWNDAAENCNSESHCPSGDSSECKNGESCYSFLPDCNYIDMVISSDQGDNSDGPPRLSGNSPLRSNWCGSDWNDAITHCADTSYWCPSGSDSDCPAGKVCFAGTDCKFTDDLYPTESPTPGPSISPTERPLVYETIENTRFCGAGWEDARNSCQIARHCPSGKNNECPAGMTCFSWMSGCNILDMRDYLDTYGVEIYGADRFEMNPSGDTTVANGSGEGDSSSATTNNWPGVETDSDADSSTGVPPSLSLSVWTPQPAPVEKTPVPILTEAPVSPENRFYPEHHVFCGESWLDAQSRCSESTFCSGGAVTHVCENENEFCWVGITACDAGDWLLTEETLMPIVSTPSPIEQTTIVETPSPSAVLDIITKTPIVPTRFDSSTATSSELDRFSTKQSLCAKDYIHLLQECATLVTCNTSLCPDGHLCFKNVLCDKPNDYAPESVVADELETLAPISTEPSPPPILPTMSPVAITTLTPETQNPTEQPTRLSITTLSPETQNPTEQPTRITLSDAEIAQRMSNPNNYCAKTFNEIFTTCSYGLKTCNDDDPMCPMGTYCFGNIVCPSPTNSPSTKPPVSVAITTLEPITAVIDDKASVDPAAQSYCADSEEAVQSTCATGFTCNKGSHTCPFGTLCFSNVVCEALQNQAPALLEETSQNTFAGNYCAESESMLQSTCEHAIACDGQYGTCPLGTFCFFNVVCEALQVHNEEAAKLTDDDECNDLCLDPVIPADCDYILSMGSNILPCTGKNTTYEKETGMDHVCVGMGRCGTNLNMNNCDTNQDLFVRVAVSKCEEAGLGRSGVLFSDVSNIISTPANVAEPERTETQTLSTEDSSNTTNDPIVYSWEEPTKSSNIKNQDEIDSWWIMVEERSASIKQRQSIFLFAAALLPILIQ